MTAPFFSVIVPTFNRARTLEHTLRTIKFQDFTDAEIIVSDNCSTDNTRQVIHDAAIANLRYINPGRQLPMSGHWEFALQHACGRYVAFLGDDDGVVRNGLSKASALIGETGYPEALSGINVQYHWPDSPILFHQSLCRIPIGHRVECRSARSMMELVRQTRRNYPDLPMLYRAFVRRDVIDRIKAKTGSFFRSCIPDVYACVAVASSIQEFVHTSEPFFIEGVSGESNGAKTLAVDDIVADKSFFVDDSIPFHPSLPYAPALSFLTAECMIQAWGAGLLEHQDTMAPADVLSSAARDAVSMLPHRHEQTWAAISALAERSGLQQLAANLKREHALATPLQSPFSEDTISFFRPRHEEPMLQLRSDHFGCRNVYECAELAWKFGSSPKRSLDPVLALASKTEYMELVLQSLTSALQDAKSQLTLLKNEHKTFRQNTQKSYALLKSAVTRLHGSRRWKWSRLFCFPPLSQISKFDPQLIEAVKQLKRTRDQF